MLTKLFVSSLVSFFTFGAYANSFSSNNETNLESLDDLNLDGSVSAIKTKIGRYNGAVAHFAYYSDYEIVTIIKDSSQTFEDYTQLIIIGQTPVSITNRWCFEELEGVNYIKHTHDTCCVYTTLISQCVVTNFDVIS